eukprot:NODE_90_length_21806_cov_0.389137.p11 type:complete len:116 gc:universal NODE_90_length_21806_cov_0.389137:12539-12886(+)
MILLFRLIYGTLDCYNKINEILTIIILLTYGISLSARFWLYSDSLEACADGSLPLRLPLDSIARNLASEACLLVLATLSAVSEALLPLNVPFLIGPSIIRSATVCRAAVHASSVS